MSAEGFCTECRVEILSFTGLTKCPQCGTTGVPCSYQNQVTPSINWHELHLLCVWAERFGQSIQQAGLVYGIAQALEAQYPDRHKLTLAGEVNEVKKEYPGTQLFDGEGKEIQT